MIAVSKSRTPVSPTEPAVITENSGAILILLLAPSSGGPMVGRGGGGRLGWQELTSAWRSSSN